MPKGAISTIDTEQGLKRNEFHSSTKYNESESLYLCYLISSQTLGALQGFQEPVCGAAL